MKEIIGDREMKEIIGYRREFHRFAETGWTEIRTSARVAEILESMGYTQVMMGCDAVEEASIAPMLRLSAEEKQKNMERAVAQGADAAYVKRTEGLAGVAAVFDSGRPGPVSAMRFDMDCLPYDEPAEADYPPALEGFLSENGGCVHACGHDGHTAMGLGIAKLLMEHKDVLCGRVKLLFQPAEETFYGAQSMVDKGYLDDVQYFMAMHIALTAEGKPLPSHTIACGCKDFLSDRQLDVTFHGKAAHPCGASQEGKNAILAACTATLNAHAIAPHEEGLCRVNVGLIHGGSAPNTIAPEASISVEFRGQTPTISAYAAQRVFDVLDGAAKTYDITYDYVDYGEVPAGASDDAMMEIVQRAAKKVPWFEKIYFEGNVGGTDDAAVMMTRVQQNGGMAVYTGIGADTTQPLHNPVFDFDEESIPAAVELCIEVLKEIHRN